MPALKPTDYTAEIVWLGIVTSDDRAELLSETRDALELRFDGIAGSVHGGRERAACVRTKAQYEPGTPIRNVRQLTIVSQEELDAIAAEIGVDAIDPARLGASMVVRGLPDFTHLPPSSRLQGPDGASVTVDMHNRPCQYPAKSIEKASPGHGKGFKPAAEGRRGVTAWVEREGRMAVGDTLTLHIPDQRAWQPES
ncbi:MOSC domain-containing protein [Tropicibacter naphthalenivorans]|uniref:Putative metal-sulfur cluster biosynthesis proteins YuaD n=1 Tax=Tropicibacter naphthalenivorans TaxID=441103 RepID=A0A0P1G9I4_9RHOB|nr:MOSC domain-containing protein [Tropicibacter naphthalenivorans]CUH78183.1 Putative metal-sulfur cluster biosynthesis proteins YuaD [Tropicibacter naphthalenivorans]SMC78179.1 MOSC domain-containing protein [Tropicibacter naphthalenivorans]